MPPSTRPKIDSNVFSKRPGVNYGKVANDAWESIREKVEGVKAIEQELEATAYQYIKGELWCLRNREHERHDEGEQMVNELCNEMKAISIRLYHAERELWHTCCTLYAATRYCDWRDSDLTDTTLPHSIWQAVMPDREPPGAWPEEPHERWIDGRVGTLDWQARKELA